MIQKTSKESKIAICRRCGGRGYIRKHGEKAPEVCRQCGGSGRVTVSGEMTFDIRPYKPRDVE